MQLFLEFFRFELKFRFKSISTYVYFGIWFVFSFLCIASENFGPIAFGNGKVLLNGPYANLFNDTFAAFFGLIIIGAIFGTSILRDFQRDTTQILFTKPITKLGYLGGRWAGSYVATAFAFSGLIFGELLGPLAPWADHSRIAPTHLWWYLQPFLSIVLVQIFFIGSLFFMVAALTRRIFIVYLQGAGLLIIYLIGVAAFETTRSTAAFLAGHPRSGRHCPQRRHHTLLDGGGAEHTHVFLVPPLGGRDISLQPYALAGRWPPKSWSSMEILSHVP